MVKKTINKARSAQDKIVEIATGGRVKVPKRGSLANQIGWVVFFMGLPIFLVLCYIVGRQKGLW